MKDITFLTLFFVGRRRGWGWGWGWGSNPCRVGLGGSNLTTMLRPKPLTFLI